MRRRARKRQEKIQKGRQISKRLLAALLRSFRRQHGEKMVSVRKVPGVTGTLGKANSHFDRTKQVRGPHHYVVAAAGWCRTFDFLRNCKTNNLSVVGLQ